MTKRMTPERYAECLGGDDVDPVDLFKIAMAQAHAEGQGALRAVVENLLDVMEMQERRESGAFHITGEVMWGIWSDAKANARAALARQ